MTETRAVDDFLDEFETPDFDATYLRLDRYGQPILLRGKYAGEPLNRVPRGYIRKFILQAWMDEMTCEEREIFEHYGKKEDEPTITED